MKLIPNIAFILKNQGVENVVENIVNRFGKQMSGQSVQQLVRMVLMFQKSIEVLIVKEQTKMEKQKHLNILNVI